jgi:starvation-inducible DNA-binding protein
MNKARKGLLSQQTKITHIMDAEKISLEEKKVKPVVDHLNDLLANYHIHYQKLRGCHWNVKGSNFFTLHIKFEELYTAALTTIDELAERILTLGKPPYSTFKDYITTSTLKEINTIGLKDKAMVKAIIEDMATLIEMERELLDITADAGDDGTNDMVNRFMQFKEKNTWMLRSFVNED